MIHPIARSSLVGGSLQNRASGFPFRKPVRSKNTRPLSPGGSYFPVHCTPCIRKGAADSQSTALQRLSGIQPARARALQREHCAREVLTLSTSALSTSRENSDGRLVQALARRERPAPSFCLPKGLPQIEPHRCPSRRACLACDHPADRSRLRDQHRRIPEGQESQLRWKPEGCMATMG